MLIHGLRRRSGRSLAAGLVAAGLATVVLAHLSRRCNSPEAAHATVEPVLRRRGFTGIVRVALQDEPLPPIPLCAPATLF